MMAHAGGEELLVHRPRALDLACHRIAAFGYARIARPDQAAGPYKTISDQNIGWGVVALARCATPQPLAVLGRGYAIALHQGKALTGTTAVKVGDALHVRLAEGALEAEVRAILPEVE